MEELLRAVIENIPNLLGLVLFGVAMWYQNNRLLDTLFGEIDELKHDIAELRQQVTNLHETA